ncbi:MAG TPA: PorP/SprF family type IX secretion system membrane protein [Flavobacteriales bacterium]|nr:PorP/SprF family type IX secretion system membrane protein [Flavobacteriales bacterium]
MAFCVLTAHATCAQDVHFSQFFNAPLTLNPALTGAITSDQRAALIHRSQWQSLGAPFRTFAFSYDAPLLRGRMNGRYLGVGATAYSDKAGKSGYGDTQGGISLAYGLRTGDAGILAAGIQCAYGQRSAVLDGLRWDAQYDGSGYDPSRPTGESLPNTSTSFIDLSSGVVWQHRDGEDIQWSAGIAAFHLNQPSVTLFGTDDDVLRRRYTVHASARFASKRWVYLPRFYASAQGGSREIVFGGLLHRRVGTDSRYTTDKTSSSFHAGVFYRWNDAIVPMIQVEYKRMITAGISYDVNISGLRNASRYKGGMEVTLRYIGAFGDKRRHLPRRSSVN